MKLTNDNAMTLLFEVDNVVHVVAMKRDSLDAVSLVARHSAEVLVKTKRTQNELREFLGFGEKPVE